MLMGAHRKLSQVGFFLSFNIWWSNRCMLQKCPAKIFLLDRDSVFFLFSQLITQMLHSCAVNSPPMAHSLWVQDTSSSMGTSRSFLLVAWWVKYPCFEYGGVNAVNRRWPHWTAQRETLWCGRRISGTLCPVIQSLIQPWHVVNLLSFKCYKPVLTPALGKKEKSV